MKHIDARQPALGKTAINNYSEVRKQISESQLKRQKRPIHGVCKPITDPKSNITEPLYTAMIDITKEVEDDDDEGNA